MPWHHHVLYVNRLVLELSNVHQMCHICVLRVIFPYMYIIFTLENATYTDMYVIDSLESSDKYICLWTGWVLGQWNIETWNSAYNRADSRLRPANERRRYIVAPFLIGWAQTHNQSCCNVSFGPRETHSRFISRHENLKSCLQNVDHFVCALVC